MKIEEQRTAELRRLAGLVDGIGVAMLTTHAEDGSMVSRPLEVLKFDGDGEFVFFTAIDSYKVAQLDEHARHAAVIDRSCKGVFVLAFVVDLREFVLLHDG